MTHYSIEDIFANNNVLCYCEKHGICAVHSRRGNIITYYSYFGGEGYYKVVKNVRNGKETRTHLNWKKSPKWLGGNYNYYCG